MAAGYAQRLVEEKSRAYGASPGTRDNYDHMAREPYGSAVSLAAEAICAIDHLVPKLREITQMQNPSGPT